MLEFATGIGFSMDIGNFLQLQGAFHSQAVVHGTADEEDIFLILEGFGQALDLVDMIEDGLALFRCLLQIGEERCFAVRIEVAVETAHIQSQEQEDDELCRISLGGGNGDFRTSPGVSYLVGFTGNRRADDVGNSQGTGTAALSFLQGSQCIDGFAGLADGDAEGLAVRQGIAIPVFRSDVDFGRDASQFFEEIFCQQAGMVSRAASDDHDLADGFDIFRRPVQFVELDVLAISGDAAAQGILESLRLFVDFLQHEVVEAALFSCFSVPIDDKDLLADGIAVHIGNPYVILLDDSDFTIIHDVRIAGIAEDGRDIRGDIVFAFAEANDEGIILLAADNLIRFSLAHEYERIGAAQAFEDLADRARKIAVVHIGAEMCDDFRIGFGFEVIALFDEFILQFHVVFDDAIVDDGEFALFVRMGMSIQIGRAAVGRPTRMADADGARHGVSLDGFDQIDESAHLLAHLDDVFIINGDASRVITTIFELGQAIQ